MTEFQWKSPAFARFTRGSAFERRGVFAVADAKPSILSISL